MVQRDVGPSFGQRDLEDECAPPELPDDGEDNWLRGMLEGGTGEGEQPMQAAFIIKVSLMVAFAWWGFGLFTVVSTQSLAVLASLVDATIDLMAQGVLLGSNRLAESGAMGDAYPVGVARLEPVGVVICAVLMVLASGAVIYDSAVTFVMNLPNGPDMTFTHVAQVMLAVVIVVKIVVWRVAKAEYDRSNNVSLEALALDNFNDILSNAAALFFASLTRVKQATWWMDPIGGVLISVYIIRSWCLTAMEQVNMLVGKEADAEIVGSIRELAAQHDADAELQNVRAYHFGPKLIVEIELVMDWKTTLQVSHDVGTSLQDRVERLDECERCFVHIDYKHREHDLHDTNVPLEDKTTKGGVRRRSGISGLRLRTALTLRRIGSGFSGDSSRRFPRGTALTRKTSTASEPCPARLYRMHSDLDRPRPSTEHLLDRTLSDDSWAPPSLQQLRLPIAETREPTPPGAAKRRPADACSEGLTAEGSSEFGSVPPSDALVSPL